MSAAPPPECHIDVLQEAGQTRVVLRGELDLTGCGPVEAALLRLLEDGAARIAVDLDRLDFLDSSGIACLVRCRQLAADRDALLVVLPGHGPPRRVLKLCGVLPFLRE